jgi:tight adherence protein B
MFGVDTTILAFIVLAGFSAGAIAYAFLFNRMADERKADRRLETVKRAETDRSVVKAARDRTLEVAKRRRSLQDSLKDIEEKQKVRDYHVKKPPLRIQLRQAGLNVTIERFYLLSAVAGLALTGGAFVLGAPLIVLPGVLLAGALGLPRWFVSLKRQMRVKAFLNEFPNALDIIVRAVKSGLPLNDGVRLIANEAPEPVRGEFRRIVESQQLGISIPEAALRMTETMPCPEAGFFGIVIQIQSQAGGNLSEALGNLSRVLRDRKKMKAKVQALSMEARPPPRSSAPCPSSWRFSSTFRAPTTSCRFSSPRPATSSSACRASG